MKLYHFHAPSAGACITVRSVHPRGRLSYDGSVVRIDEAYAERIRADWPDALEEIDEKRLAEIRGEGEPEGELEGDEKAAAKKTTAKKTSRTG